MYIATLELTAVSYGNDRGKWPGYVPAERNKKPEQVIGKIPVDLFFTYLQGKLYS